MNAESTADAIDEMKDLLEVSTDGALADALGLQKTAVAQWRRRQAIPAHAMLRLQEARRTKLAPLPHEGLEDTFSAVVGDHALMIACLLTPSETDLQTQSPEQVKYDLATSATWFAQLRLSAALALSRRMKASSVGVEEAYDAIVQSPSQLSSIRAIALGD